MKVRQVRSVGVVALSYSMVLLLAGRFRGSSAYCTPTFLGDGDCDDQNNNIDCDYDNGDCCEASCVDGEFVCGSNAGFKCLDPDYNYSFNYSYDDDDNLWGCDDDLHGNGSCDSVNNWRQCGYDGGDCCEETCVDGDYTCGRNGGFVCKDPDYMEEEEEEDDDPQQSSSYNFGFSCQEERIGNGYCNPGNNNDLCGYDGGDCCSCTCPNVPSIKCRGQAGFTCVDPTAPCLDGYVEAGTLTNITIKASRFDDPRDYYGECPPGGCTPELTRDGDFDDATSRWSCTDNEYTCVITYYFEEPLNIEYLQVAFYRPDYFSRGIQVHSSGVELGFFQNSEESTFTAYGMRADAVETLTMTSSSNEYEFEGFSLLEVRFMVEDPDT